MNIKLETNCGFLLIFESGNARFAEDVESREYQRDSDGKIIVNAAPKTDIKTDALEQVARIFEDMIYYRKAEFDSGELIERLFEKLPDNVAMDLAEKIKSKYAAHVE